MEFAVIGDAFDRLDPPPLDLRREDEDAAAADVSSDISVLATLETTMVQSPAWPATCLVRLAPGQSLGARYPVGGARVLVLQGALLAGDGRRTRPGERWTWPAGAPLGAASPGDVELICAVRAGAA